MYRELLMNNQPKENRKMINNQLLKDEVMIKFMMKRFNKTREQVIADMPPEVRKNLNVKENKFLADHLEII